MTHSLQLADTDVTFACPEDDTILRAALRAGVGFPYECNVGSCGNCKFDLVSGGVEMQWTAAPAWTDRDRDRQRYLACQAQAKSDCVVKFRMADKFRPLHAPARQGATLVSSRPITHDISEFRFQLDRPMMFEPGQYVLIALPGIEGLRAYSMSSIPTSDFCIELQVRCLPEGRGTRALFALETGTRVELDGPYGMAWLRRDARRDILCLAGGSGLAPMISIARGAMNEPRLEEISLNFIYGGRTPRDLCGEDMLSSLPGWGTRLHYTAVISMPEEGVPWSGKTGFLHEVALEMYGERLRDMEIYFAGPPAMAVAMQRMLLQAKVSFEQVHFDKFY